MFGGVESHVITTKGYIVFQQENPDNSKLAEKAAELTIGALLDVPPIFNGQTFDAITWQARLSTQSPFFVQVTWIYVFAFGEYEGSAWRQDPLHSQLSTRCFYVMGSLRRRCVGSVDDGRLSTTIDQGSFVKTRMRQKIIENESFILLPNCWL